MMSFTKTKLAKAVAMAITGSALSIAAISDASATATTMYNLTTGGGADNSTPSTVPCAPCGAGATDGWVWGGIGAAANGTTTSAAKWAGTSGTNTTPLGYVGGGVLHWAVNLSAAGDQAEISSQDAVNRYGVAADIDTAKGAWSDAALGGASGWRHDLEYGLFKSDVGGLITLSAQGVNQSGTNFGFTIFKGQDTSAGAYNHHGDWNYLNNTQPGAPTATVTLPGPPATIKQASLPGGNTNFSGLPNTATAADKNAAAIANIVAYSIGGATPSNLNTISFNAEPGQIYTIVLGGYKNGAWGDTADGYKLSVVSAVPVPGAVWLFGSAMAGLIGFGRRNKRVA